MRRLYKILYCLSFALVMSSYFYKSHLLNEYYYDIFTILAFGTFILGAIFILKNTKARVLKRELIFQISYIVFLLLMTTMAYFYNKDIMKDYMVYPYYYKLILIPYIGLNIYTFLLFFRRKD